MRDGGCCALQLARSRIHTHDSAGMPSPPQAAMAGAAASVALGQQASARKPGGKRDYVLTKSAKRRLRRLRQKNAAR